MKLLHLITCVAMLALLAGCGIQRELQLPGHDKYKHHTPDDADDKDDSGDKGDKTEKPAPTPAGNP